MASLEEADLTWLYEVNLHLNASKGAVDIALGIPVGGGTGTVAHFTETIKLNDKASSELHRTARAFALACITDVMDRTVEKGAIPCLKCSSPCCARVYDAVPVTEKDIDLWRQANVPIHVTYFEKGPRFDGYVGRMEVKPYEGPGKVGSGKCCVYLEDGWCSIWAHRPQVCRNYVWWACEKFEEDPDKDLHHRLKVVRE